jgi:hypothetical protein
MEFIMDQDRAWFREHPDQTEYCRLAIEHEWCHTGPDGTCVPELAPGDVPPGWVLHTLVTRTDDPGIRVRSQCWMPR